MNSIANRIVPFWILGVLLALGVDTPLQGQSSASFTPWAGMYVPTRNSFSGLGADIKRDNSFIGGIRFTFWGKSPLGFEFSGGFAPAKVQIAGVTVNESRNTNAFLASLKLMLGVSGASSRLGIYVGAGPAFIRRGDDILHVGTSQSDIGAAVGAGLRFPVSSGLSLRLDGEDYMYGGDFDGSKKFQNDLVLSVGLSVFF